MIFLVDTNIWLEGLLQQEKSNEVKSFFDEVPSSSLSISDFSFHSIGVILLHLKKVEVYNSFVTDLFVDRNVQLFSLTGLDHLDIIESHQKFKLDFDDTYQYIVCGKYDLKLVTFDHDFKRTDLRVFNPVSAIQEFKKIL